MQLTLVNQVEVQTMSSREIAELVGKEHKNVKRDILNMFDDLDLDALSFEHTYFDKQNRKQVEYALPKRESLILVSGYSTELRARIVDRWQELENKYKPVFTIPQTYAQALALAAEQALQLEQAKPKIEYVDKYVERGNLKTVTEVAKGLGVSGKALGKWLRDNGYAWKTTDKIIWTQPFIDKGYGEMKHFYEKGFDGTQALISAAGDVFIKEHYKK